MGLFLALNVALVGFFAFASLYHLILWSTSRREPLLAVFGLDCGIRSVFAGVLAVVATAGTTAEAYGALRTRVAIGMLLTVTWIWSLSLVSGVRARRFVWCVTILLFVLVPLHALVFPLNASVLSVEKVAMPWGESVSSPRLGPPGWWFGPLYALVLATDVFGLLCSYRLWKRDRVAGMLVMSAVGGMLLIHGVQILQGFRILSVPFFSLVPQVLWICAIALLIARRNHRMGEQLAASEQRFRGVFDQTFQFIGLLATDGRLMEANRTALEFAGIREADVIGKPFWEAPWWSHSPALQDQLRQAVGEAATGRMVRFEATHPRPDGSIAVVDFSLKPLRNESGTITLLIPEGRDITERKQAEKSLQLSEQRFSLFMQYLPGLAWIKNAEGQYVYANDAAVKAFQTSRARLYGKTDGEVFPPESATLFQKVDRQVRDSGAGVQAVESLMHEDGILHYAIVSKFPLPVPDGSGLLVGGVAIDITDRQQAEQTIRKISAFHETIIRTAAEGICVCYPIPDFPYERFSVWNERMTEITGYTIDEINRLGWHLSLFPDLELRQRAQQRMVQVLQGNDARAEQLEITRRDGQRRTLSISTSGVEVEGEGNGIVAMIQDVTERKQVDEALQMMRFSVDHAGDTVLWINRAGRILYANNAACSDRGYTREELLTMTIFDLDVEPDYQPDAWESHFEELKRRGTITLESRHRARDGRVFPIEVNANYVHIGDQEFNFAFVRDITERQRRQQRIAQLAAIVESSSDAIFGTDLDGHITSWNRGAVNVFGYVENEIVGRSVATLIPGDRAREMPPILDRVGRGEHIVHFESVACAREGRRVDVSLTISPVWDAEHNVVGTSTIARDVTELKRAEDERRKMEIQMLHAQKLESLGVLAGGLAHDFNNLLTVVLGNASVSQMLIADESPASPLLREIELAAQRAADLTQQMLAYAGKGNIAIQPLRLDTVIEEMTKLLKTAVSRKATVELNLSAATIDGDATQIRQVIMNLIINASDALEGNAGLIRVGTRIQNMDCTELTSPYLLEVQPAGHYAVFEVEDTGCGMSIETQAKIFDPFFTTKFTGRGLGLAAVLGIVRRHRGTIKLSSAPGRGTVVQVLLPCSSTMTIDNEGTGGEQATDERALPRGQGTILVVDDEPIVHSFVRRVLEGDGFQVLAAEDGLAGLNVFRKQSDAIVAVVLDLTMPRMDGLETLRELRLLAPDIPVLIMSGYTEQEVSVRCSEANANGFIQKPFGPRQLMARLFEILPSQTDSQQNLLG